VAAKPWWIDLLVVGVVFAWMGWTFTTIRELGFNLPLIVSAVIIGVVGILLIYGQRLEYVRFGKLELGAKIRHRPNGGETDGEERDKWR